MIGHSSFVPYPSQRAAVNPTKTVRVWYPRRFGMSEADGRPFPRRDVLDCVAPLSERPPAAWGVVFGDKGGIAVGVDEHGSVSRVVRGSSFGAMVDAAAAHVAAPAAVETNGIGSAALDALLHARGVFRGVAVTRAKRLTMLSLLRIRIARGEVRFPDNEIVDQLLGVSPGYQAAADLGDDAVIALALALEMRDEVRCGARPDDDARASIVAHFRRKADACLSACDLSGARFWGAVARSIERREDRA